MTTKQLRDKISEILVKHNMPTRQVAIGEIVKLSLGELKDLRRQLEGLGTEKGDKVNGNEYFMMGIDTALETIDYKIKGVEE